MPSASARRGTPREQAMAAGAHARKISCASEQQCECSAQACA